MTLTPPSETGTKSSLSRRIQCSAKVVPPGIHLYAAHPVQHIGSPDTGDCTLSATPVCHNLDTPPPPVRAAVPAPQRSDRAIILLVQYSKRASILPIFLLLLPVRGPPPALPSGLAPGIPPVPDGGMHFAQYVE